jgi:hypothetical protein
VITQAKLFALRLKIFHHLGWRTVPGLFRRTENIQPEDFKAQRPQAGGVMQIEPLHPAAVDITRSPRTGDDDFFHESKN